MESLKWLKHVLVGGVGTMGRGIVQVCLEAGYQVTAFDPDEDARREARNAIRTGLEKSGKGDRIANLNMVGTVPETGPFQVGIEAVPERLDLKKSVLSDMAVHVTEILATNTSSIPLADLDVDLEHPERLVGLHFMNPVPIMPLVEWIVREETPAGVVEQSKDLVESLGKTPVRVSDAPGFVSNRLLMATINRAIRLVEEGVAEPEAIDDVMTMGMGHEMGPLEVADFIGLDVCLETMTVIDERVEEDAYRPARLLRDKVEEGHLGRKTDEGFYRYD